MDVAEPPQATPARGRGAMFSLLGRNADFRRLFVAMLVSFAGDWFLFVALTGLVHDLTGSAALVAGMFAATTVPFALMSFLGGHLADRIDRRLLMVVSDVVRGLLALGFFLVDSPSEVWLAFVLAGAIAALGALFQPAASAAVPNLVDPEDLGPANVLVGATWGTMLAVGSALGGLVVAAFGREAGYITDAASFLVSALLIVGIRHPMAERREEDHAPPGLLSATMETFRYARADHRVLALLTVKGGFGISAGLVGLLPVVALEVFEAGDRGTGILLAFRGAGVVLAPFLVKRLMRPGDLRPVFLAIPVAFAVSGAFYSFAGWAPWLLLTGALVFMAHLGGGAQWTLSTFALQVIVPDRIRGRVFAFDYGLVTFTIAVSATVAGAAADATDVRVVMTVLAGLAMAYALLWSAATARVRRSLAERPVTPDAPAEV